MPNTPAARFVTLADRMEASGPNLGYPHTEAFGGGLFELRIKGAEGTARVFYCTLVGRRIVMLHSFIKKTQKTPPGGRCPTANSWKSMYGIRSRFARNATSKGYTSAREPA